MKKIFLVLFVFSVILVFYFYPKESYINIEQNIKENPFSGNFENENSVDKSFKSIKNLDKKVKDAIIKSDKKHLKDAITINDSLKDKPFPIDVPYVAIIRIDEKKLTNLDVGDSFEVPNIISNDNTLNITKKILNPDESITFFIKSNEQIENNDFATSFTINEKSNFSIGEFQLINKQIPDKQESLNILTQNHIGYIISGEHMGNCGN